MQQTNRTNTDDSTLDRYWTPEYATVLAVLELEMMGLLDGVDTIAEPCCGAGWLAAALEVRGYQTLRSDVSPVDQVDGGQPAHLSADNPVLWDDRWAGQYGAVITNPPYTTADTTAGELLGAIRQHTDVPMAALLRISWLEGACSDRQWCWYADPPQRVLEVGRVEYDGPDAGPRNNNPMTSVWVIWGADRADQTVYRSVPPATRDRLKGQLSVFGDSTQEGR